MCNCISEPPIFDLPPPPDPSLIWHLISDEPFQQPEQCSSSSFITVSDIDSSSESENVTNSPDFAVNVLLAIATLSVLLLIVVCVAVIGRMKRRRRENAENSKKMSSDSILVAGEHLWTYNSMKPNGVLMYSNNSNAGSRLFHHTPTTLRSYIGSNTAIPQIPPIRHSESTTLRLNPHDHGSAYHTVSLARSHLQHSDVYDEIGPPTNHYMSTMSNRMSIRRPPPKCRPPQPPSSIEQQQQHTSPSCSELDESNDNGGRESGYGTAPSWKSPSGSARIDTTPTPNPHTMTYV